MKRLLLATILATCYVDVNAQLYVFPAPPMTVADCPVGKMWIMKNNLPTCDYPAPPPPPPPPPPLTCRFQYPTIAISIGPMGDCSADGGCAGQGIAVNDGSYTAAWSRMWSNLEITDEQDLYNKALAALATSQYRLGAWKRSSLGNGNYGNLSMYEVCK